MDQIRVGFINHAERRCGVYQYGSRLASVLSGDERYLFDYLECTDCETFLNWCQEFDKLIFNWHPSTMNWLTPEIAEISHAEKTFVHHEGAIPTWFGAKSFLMSDMSENRQQGMFGIPRPIPVYHGDENNSTAISAGTFGFGFDNKGFDRCIDMLSSEFDQIDFNMHITAAFFGDAGGTMAERISNFCRQKAAAHPNVNLRITNNFLSEADLLRFLSNNTFNIFLYDDMIGRGLASTIDYAIAVDRPLVINSTFMFRHLLAERPEISVDNNSIKDILEMGNEPVKFFKNLWSTENLRNAVYGALCH